MKLSKSEQQELDNFKLAYGNRYDDDRTKCFNYVAKSKIQEVGLLCKLNTALLGLIIAILVFCVTLKIEVESLKSELEVKPRSETQQVKDLGTPPPPLKLVGGY